MPQVELHSILAAATGCQTQVVAAYVTAGANRGNVSLSGEYPAFMDALQKGSAPVVLIALGSPYLLRSFPGVSAFLATFSSVQTAETAAAKAILGQVAISGRLPVTIPGMAKLGEGINLGGTQSSRAAIQ